MLFQSLPAHVKRCKLDIGAAARGNNLQAARQLQCLGELGPSGHWAVVAAACYGKTATLLFLLDVWDWKDMDAALYYAAKQGHPHTVFHLLKRGANPHREMLDALTAAQIRGYPDVVQILRNARTATQHLNSCDIGCCGALR